MSEPAPKGTGYSAPPNTTEVALFQKPRLPWHDQIEKSFGDIGVTKQTWKALIDAIYPGAQTADSVILALSYCKARNLDPFKRPIHIVPVWNNEKRALVDTIWPGIAEIRTTAVRTGQFGGADAAIFGPDKTRTFEGETGRDNNKKHEKVTLAFPEWAQITVYRITPQGQRVAIAGPRVYWEETYACQGRTELPNSMWQKRTRGQLEKCAEAAALRRAFPEEIGNEQTAEEMGQDFYDPSKTIEHAPAGAAPPRPKADDQAPKPTPEPAPAPEPEPRHDPETGEIHENGGGGAAPPAQPSQAAPQPPKAAPPPPPPAPKPPEPKREPDNYDAYLETMLKEFAAEGAPSDKAMVERTFLDAIDGYAEHNMLSPERAAAFKAAWKKRTAPKKAPAAPKPAEPASQDPRGDAPPQEVAAEDRAADYAAWKKAIYEALLGCKTPGDVDALQDVQLNNFNGDADQKAFISACNKRVRDIVAAPQK